LGTSEHEESGGKQKAIGSTHTDISALFESAAHAKRLFRDIYYEPRSGVSRSSIGRPQQDSLQGREFNLVLCLIGTKDMRG
jgi:hypothetical protein